MSEQVIVENEIVTIVSVGEQGPPGPPGASGDKHYEQSFTNQSSVTVDHNLGKFPSVTVIDTANDEVEGSVDHISINQVIVSFSASFSGKVVCN